MPDGFTHYMELEFQNVIKADKVREINYLKGLPSFNGKRMGD